MSPRPRLKSDAEILAATVRAIERVGPRRLTLADVGREAGMAPATLLQRFGSKRGLLLALAQTGASSVREEFGKIRADSPSPLQAVRAIGACMAQMANSPEAFANHLAFLEIDLADPEFHALALAHAREFRRQLQALLNDAVRAGELRGCSTARLANAIQGMIGGSLLNWAVHREGKPMAWVSADLDMLLGPYRAEASGRRGRDPK
jgi:AcrR family transcriptional regulator